VFCSTLIELASLSIFVLYRGFAELNVASIALTIVALTIFASNIRRVRVPHTNLVLSSRGFLIPLLMSASFIALDRPNIAAILFSLSATTLISSVNTLIHRKGTAVDTVSVSATAIGSTLIYSRIDPRSFSAAPLAGVLGVALGSDIIPYLTLLRYLLQERFQKGRSLVIGGAEENDAIHVVFIVTALAYMLSYTFSSPL